MSLVSCLPAAAGISALASEGSWYFACLLQAGTWYIVLISSVFQPYFPKPLFSRTFAQ
jgi:hypothetical protein